MYENREARNENMLYGYYMAKEVQIVWIKSDKYQ